MYFSKKRRKHRDNVEPVIAIFLDDPFKKNLFCFMYVTISETRASKYNNYPKAVSLSSKKENQVRDLRGEKKRKGKWDILGIERLGGWIREVRRVSMAKGIRGCAIEEKKLVVEGMVRSYQHNVDTPWLFCELRARTMASWKEGVEVDRGRRIEG